MERIKIFLRNAFSYPRLLLRTHPVTAVSMITATVMFAIYNIMQTVRGHKGLYGNYTPFELFLHISLAVLFFAIFSLCIESLGKFRKKPVKIAVFSALALLSLFMSFITADFIDGSHLKLLEGLVSFRDRIGFTTVLMYIGGLLVIAILAAVYFSYVHNVSQPFNVHFTNINSKLFFTSIIYSVIQLGVLFLTIIVMTLLYDDAFDFLFPIIILINGLFYAPAVVCSLTRENENANMFFQVLVRYVMLTISAVAYSIIYIYMIKLIVTASVPSNSVYAILTALFIVSMYIAYMCTTFEEKGPLQKFAYYSPLIFAPFILMQCYTVFVRIGQYGLTPKRYFGIAFIIFEIAYIIYYTVMKKREKETAGSGIILIISAIVILSVFVPGINATALSDHLAKRTLSSYLEKVEEKSAISPEEYVLANAAYGFLRDRDFGKDRIDRYFSAIDEDTVKNLHDMAKNSASKIRTGENEQEMGYEPDSYGWYNTDITELSGGSSLDISGYSRLAHIYIRSERDPETGDGKCDPTKLSVFEYSVDSDGKVYEDIPYMDLSDFCKKFNDYASDLDANNITDNEFRNRCANICVIDIKENVRLYITDADISRDQFNECVNVNLEGYLLIK